MKKILACFLSCLLLLLMAGCGNKTETPSIDPAYTPITDASTMTYDSSTDKTTITNHEASVQLPGQWEQIEGGYYNQTYGFVNLVAYNGLVSVENYSNEYSSSANWSIDSQESTLTIATLPSGATTYGFHINSSTSTYKFIYTTIPGMQSSDSSIVISTVLQSFQLKSSGETSE